MVSGSAQSRALSITEILENVLAHLKVGDLLRAESVCHRWRDAITASPKLQTAKWFNGDVQKANQEATGFRGVESHDPDLPYINFAKDHNPLCTQRFYQQVGYQVLRELSPSVKFFNTDVFVLSKPHAFADKTASWRRMLLFDPPRTKIRIGALSSRAELPPYTLHNDNGLMLEDLFLFFDGLVKGPAMTTAFVQATVQRKWTWLLMDSPDDQKEKTSLGTWG